eukprot:163957_1
MIINADIPMNNRHLEPIAEKLNTNDHVPNFESTMVQIHKEVEKHLPNKDLVNLILFHSNHIGIYNLWLNIYNKLGEYSFLMKNGVAISEIIQYEKDNNIKLPPDMRISILFCNGIYFPPIFDNDATNILHPQTVQGLNFSPEILLDSLHDWRTITVANALALTEDDFQFTYFNNEEWRKDEKLWNELQHFFKWDDINFDGENFDENAEKCFKFIKIIGDVPIYGDGIGNSMYWNVRTGKLYSQQWDNTIGIMEDYYYDSFLDFLTKWSTFDYFNNFNRKWLRFDVEIQSISKVIDINTLYEEILWHLAANDDWGVTERSSYFRKTGMKFSQILNEQCNFQSLRK